MTCSDRFINISSQFDFIMANKGYDCCPYYFCFVLCFFFFFALSFLIVAFLNPDIPVQISYSKIWKTVLYLVPSDVSDFIKIEPEF
jgi:hypothetical protein